MFKDADIYACQAGFADFQHGVDALSVLSEEEGGVDLMYLG
jgi:hypothetical protein